TGHAERVHRTGFDTHAAEETAGHVHVVFFGIPLRRLTGHFRADHTDDTRGAGGFAQVASHTLLGAIVIAKEREHAPIVVRQVAFLERGLDRDGFVIMDMPY